MRQAAQKFTSTEIRQFSPMDKMSDDDAQELLRTAITNQLSAGTRIFGADDDDKRIFYLIDGEVEITTNKQEKIIVKADTPQARQPMGHHVDEQHAAKATTDSVLISFDADMIELFVNWTNPNAYQVNEVALNTDNEWVNRLLQSRGLLRFSEEQIQILIKRMQEVHFQAGDTIINQNDNDNYYYIIKNGSCEVSRQPDLTSNKIKLAELHEGDAFGEEALLSDAPRNATITMREDGDLMRLSKEDFSKLLAEPLLTTVPMNDAKDLVAMGAMFLDVRLPEEYEIAHLPGSINIPIALLRLKLKQLSHHRKYIICCDDGSRSATAAFLMNRHGFDAFILDGGLPTETLFEPPQKDETKNEAANEEPASNGPASTIGSESTPKQNKKVEYVSFAESWSNAVDEPSNSKFRDNFDIKPTGKTAPLVNKIPNPVKTTNTKPKFQQTIPSAAKNKASKPEPISIDAKSARRTGRMLNSFLGLAALGIAAYFSLDNLGSVASKINLVKTTTPTIEINASTKQVVHPNKSITTTPIQETASGAPVNTIPTAADEMLDLTPWLSEPENELTELVSEPDLPDLLAEQVLELESDVFSEEINTEPAVDPSTRGIKFE